MRNKNGLDLFMCRRSLGVMLAEQVGGLGRRLVAESPFSMDEVYHCPDLHPLQVTGTEEERLEKFIKVRDEIRFRIEKAFVVAAPSRQVWTLLLHAAALQP